MTINDNYRQEIEKSFSRPSKPKNPPKNLLPGERGYDSQKEAAKSARDKVFAEIREALKSATPALAQELNKYNSACIDAAQSQDCIKSMNIFQQWQDFKAENQVDNSVKDDRVFKDAVKAVNDVRAGKKPETI